MLTITECVDCLDDLTAEQKRQLRFYIAGREGHLSFHPRVVDSRSLRMFLDDMHAEHVAVLEAEARADRHHGIIDA